MARAALPLQGVLQVVAPPADVLLAALQAPQPRVVALRPQSRLVLPQAPHLGSPQKSDSTRGPGGCFVFDAFVCFWGWLRMWKMLMASHVGEIEPMLLRCVAFLFFFFVCVLCVCFFLGGGGPGFRWKILPCANRLAMSCW